MDGFCIEDFCPGFARDLSVGVFSSKFGIEVLEVFQRLPGERRPNWSVDITRQRANRGFECND